MSAIKLLNNGKWNKPPVLTAARKIMMEGLADRWPRKPLGSLATFVNGTSYDFGALTESGTPIIRISNVTDPQSDFLMTQETFGEKYIVRPGDLLVSWSASFKSVIWPGPEGVLNQHIFKVTEQPGNCRAYIRHAIEAAFDEMQQKVVGIGMMHLRRSDFLGHEVPIPSASMQEAVANFLDWVECPHEQPEPPLPPQLSEQRRTVARIEELTAKIEEARGLRRQSSSEAQQLFMATADAEMNRLAKDYPTAKVSDIEDLVTSGPRNFGSRYTQSGPRFYRAQDISPSGRVTDDNIVQVEIPEGMSTRAVVREGDVLVVITGATIGRSAVITPHLPAGLVSQHVGLIRVDRAKVEPQFLQYAMLSPAWAGGQLDEVKYGQGKPGLNLNNLRSLAFPLPPLYEQQQVVTHLNDLQARVDVLTQLQVETAAELDALLPSVLDRAFSGEL